MADMLRRKIRSEKKKEGSKEPLESINTPFIATNGPNENQELCTWELKPM